MRGLIVTVCIGLALAGGLTRFSSAAFTRSTAVAANSVGVDRLSNYFSVTPGSAVQVSTSTPVASGNVDTLSLAFGTVPSARTFTSVFTTTNVSASSHTATLTLVSVPQIASAVFASSGTTSVTLAPGASTTLSVTTSTQVAGHGSGTLKLGLAGTSWLYRTYSMTVDESPEAPSGLSATAQAAGHIALSWTASSTTTNLAGYDVYRSSGSGFSKLNATPVSATTYTDTTAVDATTYTYKVEAVSSGTPPLQSLDSGTASATADATPPTISTATYTDNSGTTGDQITGTTEANARITIAETAPGSATYTGTANAGGTFTITVAAVNGTNGHPVNVSYSVTATDAAGNTSQPKPVTAADSR